MGAFRHRGKHGRADNGLLTISVRTASLLRLSEMEKRIAAVEQLLEKNIPAKERLAILSEIGLPSDGSVQFSSNVSAIDATLFVQLSGERSQSAAGYAAMLRRLLREEVDMADLSIRFTSRDMPTPVDVRIKGEKQEEAMRLAQQIRRRLSAIKGAVDVDIAQRMDLPYLLITVNPEKAKNVGLDATDVIGQVVAALKTGSARERDFRIDWKTDNQVSAALPYHPDMKLQDVLDTPVTGKQSIRLGRLASLQRITQPVEIDHIDLSRIVDVCANIEDRSRGDVIADTRSMIDALRVPTGIKVELAE